MNNREKKYHITAITVNYFSSNKILKLVESINIEEGFSLIIVDNSNSKQEQLKLVEICERYSWCSLIVSEENIGFSAGTNNGIQACVNSCSGILIINPDITLDKDFIKIIKSIHFSLPEIAISPHGNKMLDQKTWSAGGKFYWLKARADVTQTIKKTSITNFGTCACLLVPSSFFKKNNLLDEDYFLGGEEWDLSLRIRKNNIPILYVPYLIYFHEVSGTHEKYGLKYFYIGIRTKILFAKKTYGLFFYPWFFLILVPSIPFLIIKNLRKHNSSIFKLFKSFTYASVRSFSKQKITLCEINRI